MNRSIPHLSFASLFFILVQSSFAQNYGYCDCVTLGNCPVPINDNGTFESIIPIDMPGPNDLSQCPLEEVCFTITHTWIGDLSVSLTSPAGDNYLLMADVNNDYGGCGMQQDNIEVCLVAGDNNPLTNNTEYICLPGPCNSASGVCCLTGEYTLPCGGVTDPISGALQAPNCDLNDFNKPGSPVNGIWFLRVTDVCNMDVGTLDNFSLKFACDDFADSTQCEANGGYFYQPPIRVCEGDLLLAVEAESNSCAPPAPVDLFKYVYLVTRNDTIVSVADSVDMTNEMAGHYLIYGFSFENAAEPQVEAMVGQPFSSVQTVVNAGGFPYCSDLSINHIEVVIDIGAFSLPCEDVRVDAGPDILVPCGEERMLYGESSFGTGSECIDYQWKKLFGSQNSDSDSMLVEEPGQYVFSVVVDQVNCVVSDTMRVIYDPGFDVQIEASYDCLNQQALLEVQVDAGIGYQYRWYKLGSNSWISNSSEYLTTEEGSYRVGVRNLQGCWGYDTVIVDFSSLVIENIEIVNADCDEINGSVTLHLIQGSSDFEILWSTGATTQTVTGLAPGEYTVTVTDGTCFYEKGISVAEDLSCKVVMRGHVYNDFFEPDCMVDNYTYGVEGIMLHLLPEDIYTYSKPDGSYEFIAFPGDHIIEYIDEDEYEPICPGPISFQLPDGGEISTNNNFYVKKEAGQNLKVSVTKGPARPGRQQQYTVSCTNLGSSSADAILTFEHDPLLEEVSLLTTAHFYDPDIRAATWFIANMVPGEEEVFQFKMYLPSDVAIGTELTGSVKVDPVDIDNYPSDNTINWTQSVIASYDPNEKSSHTGDNQWGGAISANDTTILYQVLFQNTGTDTAFNVVIRDTLDEKLDVESIRVGTASHDYELEFEGRNVLVFNFQNIMLPDSNINEPGSHGFVTFSINRSKEIIPYEEIKNSVAIYFDFNAPIITNETVHFLNAEVVTIENTVHLCQGEVFNGEIYNDDTVLIDTVSSIYLDSIFITNINIVIPSETWIEAEMCDGDSIEFNGAILTDAGVYTAEQMDINGCDSLVNLNLEVFPNWHIEVDTAVVVGGEIYGYTVFSDTTIVQELLDNNGCVYTLTATVSVFVNSYELKEEINLQILPNPNNGQFILKGKLPQSGKYKIVIYNIYGQLITRQFNDVYLNKGFELPVENEFLANGIYYLQLAGKGQKAVVKFAVTD
ncbi:MAG: proprotein convertase P-domain-containing protein [Bacteroidota bacterium]